MDAHEPGDRERAPTTPGATTGTLRQPRHRWLVRAREAQAGAPSILCFPHAGGTPLAAGPLVRHLPEHIGMMAVNLPGREGHGLFPAPRRAACAAAAIAETLMTLDRLPSVFLGNSYGALLAYETARTLVQQGAAEPRLIVSGFRSPLLPPVEGPLFNAPRSFLRSELAARFGVSARDLDQLGSAHFEPALRADLEACETYRHVGKVCLSHPIEVLIMTDDPAVSRDELMAWEAVSAGGARLHPVRGQHFCWTLQAETVAAAVERLLSADTFGGSECERGSAGGQGA